MVNSAILFFFKKAEQGGGKSLGTRYWRSRLSPGAAVGIVDPVNVPKDPFEPHKTVQFCH